MEICTFSSIVQKYFTHEHREWVNYYFSNSWKEILYLQAAKQGSIYYINTDETQNHFIFAVKCTIYMYYVTKVMVIFSHYEDDTLFSHVRTSYFRVKAHLLHIFHRCLYKINLSSVCISGQSCFRSNYISLHLDEILFMYIYLIRRFVV